MCSLGAHETKAFLPLHHEVGKDGFREVDHTGVVR